MILTTVVNWLHAVSGVSTTIRENQRSRGEWLVNRTHSAPMADSVSARSCLPLFSSRRICRSCALRWAAVEPNASTSSTIVMISVVGSETPAAGHGMHLFCAE